MVLWLPTYEYLTYDLQQRKNATVSGDRFEFQILHVIEKCSKKYMIENK